MLIQINDTPTQFFTSNASDLDGITEPHTVLTQTTKHQSLSHDFLNPNVVSNFTSSSPYSTKVSETSTTTFIVTLTN